MCRVSRECTIKLLVRAAALALPIHLHFSVEPYLVRQVDFAGNAAITNAIGLILIAAF